MTSPPTTGKYPSEEQIAQWIADYFASVEHRRMRYEAYLAMRACDYQRECDSLIAANIAAPNSCSAIEEILWEVCTQTTSHAICHAIRTPSQGGRE